MRGDDCDILIVGGGLVGLSLALALSGSGLSVTVVDKAAPNLDERGPDERHLALSEVSCRVLSALAIVPMLGADAEPIRALHVSSQGEFGVTRWAATDVGRPQFGLVVPARRLHRAIQQRVMAQPDIQLLAPASVSSTHDEGEHVVATVTTQTAGTASIRARLLVIADGVDSALRSEAGIDCTRHDYHTSAICCAVNPERDHQGTAYERFTRTGPVALLPQAQGRCGAVWVVPSSEVPRRMALTETAFLAELQAAFGYRLGRLQRAGERVSYPLRRVLAERLTAPRRVLIGNAAQAMHPVGAQGFNLGLRDVAALAERVLAAQRAARDPGAAALLADYAQARAHDRTATTGLSHALASSTTLRAAPAALLRSLALIAADRIAPLREHLQLGGMGYRGSSSELARAMGS